MQLQLSLLTSLLALSFLIVSCKNKAKKENKAISYQADSAQLSKNHSLGSKVDSVLFKGVVKPAKGRPIDPDSVARPKATPVGKPQINPIPINVYPVKKPKTVQIPKELKVITPGKNGVPLPKTTPAKGKTAPVVQARPVTASSPDLKNHAVANFQRLHVEQGMSSSVVHAILEDRKGNIWFGTGGGGVSRYDGYSFVHYSEEEGLLYSSIHSMLEDSRGNIWIGTDGKGLSRYDGHNFTHYTDKEGLSNNKIESILEDSQGNLWFGTQGGVNKYDGQNFTHFTEKEGLSHNWVWSIFEDHNGHLWFGTNGKGVSKYDGRRFTHYTEKEGLSNNAVRSIIEDQEGNLWFGTNKGVNKYDGHSFTHYTQEEGLNHNSIRSMLIDVKGHLWFGTHHGLNKYDPAKNEMTSYTDREGLTSHFVFSMMQDKQKNLWIGCQGDGVYRYNIGSFSAPNHFGTPYLEDVDGNLWVYAGGEVGVYKEEEQTFMPYVSKEKLIDKEIYSIIEDREGQIWVGIRRTGVSRYHPHPLRSGGSWTHYTQKEGLISNNTSSIIEDSKGNIWIGTHGEGISRYNPADNRIIHYTQQEGLSNNHIHPMLEDRKGNIWIGTEGGGLNKYDGQNFTHYTQKDGLSADQINTITEDRKGNLWFGTWNGGLNIYRSAESGTGGASFATIEKKDGLSSNIIQSIVEDNQGRFWVSTEQGLNLLIPDSTAAVSANHFQIINFGKEDGIKSPNIGRGFLDSKNRLWWIGLMLDLNEFELPEAAPSIQLNYLELAQTFVDYGRAVVDTAYLASLSFGKRLLHTFDSVAAFYNYPLNLKLPYDVNHLTFVYSGIDWTAPHKISYQFMLEGLDKDWNPITSENKADYRSLPHGRYIFKVRAAGQTMLWSEPFQYAFTILPPWWLTWWAYGLYTLMIIGLFLAIRQYELRRIHVRNEARRLKELDSVKTKLYTNITHEFRTPLTIILGMADEVLQNPQDWFREGLQLIRRNGQNLLRLVNQILDLSKLESGALPVYMIQRDIVAYLRYLTESFHSLAESKNIQLTFHSNSKTLIMDYDPDKIRHILSNLLSNAIKFTPEGGEVCITVDGGRRTVDASRGQTSKVLAIQVKDTGVGVAEQKLPYIFDRFYQADDAATRQAEGSGIGLALTKELVKFLQGEIDAESNLGKGTTFSVYLPITNKAPLSEHIETDGIEESILSFKPLPVHKAAPFAGQITEKEEAPLLLIIEDNADVVRYLTALLGGEYRLQIAENGREGAQKAVAMIPDIIISDVMMPEMDGFEVCNTLKLDERTSHIPIILLTAKADVLSRIEGLERGADAYLAKPFNKKELFVRLQNLLESRKRLQARFGQISLKQPFPPSSPRPEEKNIRIEDAFLQKVKNLLAENMSDENYGIERLSDDLGISRVQLHRKLKALTNKSTSHYIRAVRLHKGKELLQNSDLNVSQVAYEVGFKHPTYFTRLFSEEFGVNPKDIRSK